ncbi:expressed unknown protein [Seminavis robusta]|uniref:Transmembrane protein n=1 Tax=Seminavis robusta TaxID=568900 RepID=A0A9N8DED4_9STRA|nr:expressed unknown protein [Seminavis robusta]|eukprot:Sro103_g052510.1 n/a (869) ;mRNA; r:58234-61586
MDANRAFVEAPSEGTTCLLASTSTATVTEARVGPTFLPPDANSRASQCGDQSESSLSLNDESISNAELLCLVRNLGKKVSDLEAENQKLHLAMAACSSLAASKGRQSVSPARQRTMPSQISSTCTNPSPGGSGTSVGSASAMNKSMAHESYSSCPWVSPPYPQMFPYHALGGSVGPQWSHSVNETSASSIDRTRRGWSHQTSDNESGGSNSTKPSSAVRLIKEEVRGCNHLPAWNETLETKEVIKGNGFGSSAARSNEPVSSEGSSLVLLRPEEMREYTDEELKQVQLRPFPSRLFITEDKMEWDTGGLRTRHTDDHAHTSSFTQLRDAFKADAITKNTTAAKYALTELLDMCMGMEESEYYSFACTLASAFSEEATNTEFEESLLMHEARMNALEEARQTIKMTQPQLTRHEREGSLLRHQRERARNRFVQLLRIVFAKLKLKMLLVDKSKLNTYRLVLCMTKYNCNRLPFFFAIFPFYFKTCACSYLTLSLLSLNEGEWLGTNDQWSSTVAQNYGLALGVLLYGLLVAQQEIESTQEVFQYLYMYRHRSGTFLLGAMDFLSSVVLPIYVAMCGSLVVLASETFRDCVVNSVAILFITLIDDQLPRLLDLRTRGIVQGYLIDQAIEEYEGSDLDKPQLMPEFGDMLLTNTEESGRSFQPYEFFDGQREFPGGTRYTGIQQPHSKTTCSDQVAKRSSVTAHCLLRKVEWQYAKAPDHTTQPQIGHLRLTKLMDGSTINFVGRQKESDEAKKTFFSLTGVYIITNFSLSDDSIPRLRICGSQTIGAFLDAFEYYSLWPLDTGAKALLSRSEIAHTAAEWRASEAVLCGLPHPQAPTQFAPNRSSESMEEGETFYAALDKSTDEQPNQAG